MSRLRNALLIVAALGVATPALAQADAPTSAPTMRKADPDDSSQPRQRLVTVFGTDACPKPSDPDEIVVCTRRPDEERYRIPPTVRAATAKPPGVASGDRKQLLGDATGGAGGSIGSCSTVGPGGGSGCARAAADAYRDGKRP